MTGLDLLCQQVKLIPLFWISSPPSEADRAPRPGETGGWMQLAEGYAHAHGSPQRCDVLDRVDGRGDTGKRMAISAFGGPGCRYARASARAGRQAATPDDDRRYRASACLAACRLVALVHACRLRSKGRLPRAYLLTDCGRRMSEGPIFSERIRYFRRKQKGTH